MLTQSQIAEFHRDGLLIIRNLIRGRELEMLQEEAEDTRAAAEAGTPGNHLFSKKPDGRNVYYRTNDLLSTNRTLQCIAVNPELLACVGQCMGHSFLPINDAIVYKLPGGDVPVAWHQDPPYGPRGPVETGDIPNFIADIYLDRSTPANGGLYGLPRRHLAGSVDLASRTEQELFEHPDALPIEMEPGDVLFHCPSAPHGSAGNKSNQKRRIYYVHYLAKEIVSEYQSWIPRYAARIEMCREAERARAAIGLSAEKAPIALTSNGFEFAGQPGTPRYHWRELKRGLSEEQKRNIKSLVSERNLALR